MFISNKKMSDIEIFLQQFCEYQNVIPQFKYKGPRKEPSVVTCQVSGYTYVGTGNSQRKAAADFVSYLVRDGYVFEEDVPTDFEENNALDSAPQHLVQEESTLTRLAVNQSEDQLNCMDDIGEQEQVIGIHDLDSDAHPSGNWTTENAQVALSNFLHLTKLKIHRRVYYKPAEVSPFDKSEYVVEMGFFVKWIRRNMSAKETGITVEIANKNCALSLMRQLVHFGVIGSFSEPKPPEEKLSGTRRRSVNVPPDIPCEEVPKKKRKEDDEVLPHKLMPPYAVNVSPDVEAQIDDCLSELNITILPFKLENEKLPVSLLKPEPEILDALVPSVPVPDFAIPSTPPQPNWNPWTACNIEQGPLSTFEELSEQLLQDWGNRIQNDNCLQQERTFLPVYCMHSEIVKAVSDNQVTIIRGNAGCGKTTQVCQFILDDFIAIGSGAWCNILITQPQRLSVVSAAERVALERGEQLGESVGYSARYESVLPRSYGSIMFCTGEMLLRKLEGGLRGISHVIVDEVQERDMNTDCIMIILRDMVYQYPGLRIILMSAANDTTLLSKYFSDCPVISIPDRTFPVQQYFLEDCIELIPYTLQRRRKRISKPIGVETNVSGQDLNNLPVESSHKETRLTMQSLTEKVVSFELVEGLLDYIESLNVKGAILVFLPGWKLIYKLLRHLQEHPEFGKRYLILPLHSELRHEVQRRVFEPVPPGVRKLILSTNIAETSITINDVTFVINSCTERRKLFNTHNNMTTYATVWVSRSNLELRRRRAGSVRPGLCFHLCSKARFEELSEEMTPELLRSPLQEIALKIKILGFGSISHFLSKAIDPPSINALLEAKVVLREMKCLDNNDELTPLGRILAKLPIEPRLGKMVVMGCIFKCNDTLLTVAANLATLPELFVLERNKRALSQQQRVFAGVRCSDQVAVISAFKWWNQICQIEGNAEIQLCKQMGISMSILRATQETKHRLQEIVTSIGFPNEIFAPAAVMDDSKLDMVMALVCMGLYPNVCRYKNKHNKVLTGDGKIGFIHKSSVNCTPQRRVDEKYPYPFFVFGEKIFTKMGFYKQLSMVSPIHLLLFGSRKVEWVEGVVRLDDWINLWMDPYVACKILGLRRAIESLVVRAVEDLGRITEMNLIDQKVIKVIEELCRQNLQGDQKHLRSKKKGHLGPNGKFAHLLYTPPNPYTEVLGEEVG